jgi:hypothetical protein
MLLNDIKNDTNINDSSDMVKTLGHELGHTMQGDRIGDGETISQVINHLTS